MKKMFLPFLMTASVMLVSCLCLVSCDGIAEGEEHIHNGTINLCFPPDQYEAALKSAVELPDTNDFILDIVSSNGSVIYSGAYGNSPESLSVPPGSYTISIKSLKFSKPAFSKPQYGDEKCVVVPENGVMNVKLECKQLNSGIRLVVSPEFLSSYPDGVLFVSSSQGRLMYSYTEKRIAYFQPGDVSVVLSDGGVDKTLLTRRLAPQEVRVVRIHVAAGNSNQDKSNITVSIDTSRVWKDEDYTLGEGNSQAQDNGTEPADALSVNQAKDCIGDRDVWVCGYIVGGDLTKSSISFSAPFLSATNLAIASRSSASSKESCISVFLPQGAVRDGLNLRDFPENLGRRVWLKGDIVASYFGIVGLKNVTDFKLK